MLVFIFLLQCVPLGLVFGIPVNIYDQMTPEEKLFYFGAESSAVVAGEQYDLGIFRKVRKHDSFLRRLMGGENGSAEYHFQAFNTDVKLSLQRNDILVSKRTSIVMIGSDGEESREYVDPDLTNCHLIHREGSLVAAVSDCGRGMVMGFVSTPKDTFEITPLTKRLKNLLFLLRASFMEEILGEDVIVDDFYIVKRAVFPNFTMDDTSEIEPWDKLEDPIFEIDFEENVVPDEGARKVIETAIFFDHVAYKGFSAIYSDDEIKEMLLAYVNQVQALYHIPSLGQRVDLMIVHLEILKTEQFENHNGEREPLLESFCNYNNMNNPEDDKANPRHWDVGILLSGLDIWGMNNGVKMYDTMGLARTGAMCHADYSCVAVEFGVWSALGKSYPTSGFSAAYTLAHELGHSLGMRHDGFPHNQCEGTGFIMSPRRGARGQTSWSTCSMDSVLKNSRLTCLQDTPAQDPKWDHNNTMGVPGHFITAEEQCKFYYRGVDKATVGNKPDDSDFCKSLVCRNGEKVEETGPPLEGTACGDDGTRWCREGECKAILGVRWSDPRVSSCRSACLARSLGYQLVDRSCLVLEGFEDQECGGPERWSQLCDDSHLCGTRSCASQRRSRTEAATLVCEEQAQYYPAIDTDNTLGKPAKHVQEKPWMACSVFCRKRNSEGWLSPRGQYFTDGTWCHNDGFSDYYCRDHHCLPANATNEYVK